MTTEAMRAAFQAWCDDQGYVYEEYCFQAWQAATLAERERAAKVCEAEHVGDSVEDECDNKGDYAYNMALRHAAAAIRKGEAS